MDRTTEPSRSQAALSNGFVNRDNPANLQRLGQLLFGGIRGAVLRRFFQDLELWLDDLQFTAAKVGFYLSIQSHHLSGLELVPKIRGVEPDALQSRPPLTGRHLENGHAAGAKQTGIA